MAEQSGDLCMYDENMKVNEVNLGDICSWLFGLA